MERKTFPYLMNFRRNFPIYQYRLQNNCREFCNFYLYIKVWNMPSYCKFNGKDAITIENNIYCVKLHHLYRERSSHDRTMLSCCHWYWNPTKSMFQRNKGISCLKAEHGWCSWEYLLLVDKYTHQEYQVFVFW